MPELKHDNWKGNTGGTPWMQRFLIVWLRHLSLRSLYAVMACVIPWYVLLNGRGRRAIWHYFHLHQGCGAVCSIRMTFLNFYRFGQIILDRFAVYAGQRFSFSFDGFDEFEKCCAGEKGIVLLCAHVGNFEISGYSLSAGGRRINSLVFDGETETVMTNRARAFAGNNIRMVPVREDMSHIFLMNSALADGEIVTVHGDRLFGSSKSVVHDFLGAPARFPKGPYVLAASRDVPTFAVFTMKTGYKSYRIHFRRLDVPASGAGESAVEKERRLLDGYVAALEAIVREYPEQWFNYYEFWA